MIRVETNKGRAAASSRVPLRSTTAVRGVPLEPDHSPRYVAAGPHSRLVRGGAHWSGTLRLGWARTVDSHGRGIVDPNLWQCRPSQQSLPLVDASFYSPATPKAFIIRRTHCCCASPRTASLRSTHCIPTRKAHGTQCRRNHLVQQKSAELRANQEAEFSTEHR